MRLALECPTYLLKDIQPLADFDWILTHLVLEDKEYALWYRESRNFKVLDNSVNELLEPCSLEDMQKAEEVLGGVDQIVPPDFLGDSTESEKSLVEALEIWTKEKILPCVQGSNLQSTVESAMFILQLDFSRIAVPYDITCKRTDSLETMAEGRLKVVNRIIEVAPLDFQIHLLGITTLDELTRHDKGWVKSVDTGVPIVYGMNLKHLDESWNFKKDKPTMSQMADFSEFINEGSTRHSVGPMDKLASIYWNIAYLRKIIN